MRIGNYQFDPELAWELGEKLVYAAAILIAAYFLAKVFEWAFAKLVEKVPLLKKGTGSGDSVGLSLSKIVTLLIWVFALLAILQVFGLGGVMTPLQTMLNNVMGFIPNLLGAGLLFFIGLVIAQFARELTVTVLGTVDFDKWANRGGVDTATGNTAITKTIGTIVYAVIVIFFSILALDALDLESVSAPASDMLRLILDAIPRIIGAALLLAIGYLISRFGAQLLKEVLPGLGFDRAVEATELVPSGTSASSILARVAQIAIVLFFAIAATRLLDFPELTAILNQILDLGGRVIFGSVVILVGFLIANMLARLISGSGQASLAANVVRWAAIVLFTFMGLEFMGVGEEIVRLAFGALVVGGAVAGALAFGLGGRDWAARQLQKWENRGGSSF